MAGFTMNVPDLIFMQWILVRYVPPDGPHLAPAALFGVIVLCARIIEGISCTIIAHSSDVCRSRWGRRLPFMRFGIGPFVLGFFLIFMPPIDHMHWINSLYAAALIPVYFILYGIVITPYLALIPEITPDLKERVDLTTSQSVFMLIGTFTFAAFGIVLNKWGWALSIGGVAVLVTFFFIPAATRIRENPRAAAPDQEQLRYFQSVWLTLKNRPFRYVLASTAIYWFGLNAVIALVPHWTISFLGRSEGDVTLLMAPFLLMNVVFFFVFNALAAKLGKYVLMLATFLGSGVVIVMLCLVGHLPLGSEFLQTAVIMALFGAPVAGFMVLPFAVLGDVVDYDEQLTGHRREAIFFGVQGIFQKLMIGVSVLTFTIVPYIGGDGTRRLCEGGSLIFSGTYAKQSGASGSAEAPVPTPAEDQALEAGAIRVDVSPDTLGAPWTLYGPGGFVYGGAGDEDLRGLSLGEYRLAWGEASGWTAPEPQRAPTAHGLKLMVLLCALSGVLAFLVFLKYPMRERDGKAVLIDSAHRAG